MLAEVTSVSAFTFATSMDFFKVSTSSLEHLSASLVIEIKNVEKEIVYHLHYNNVKRRASLMFRAINIGI